jgi:hypothetical protein
MPLLVATISAAINFQTGSGGPPSYMGYPRCAPQAVWDASLADKGPPLIRPDGAGVVKATNEGGCNDEDDDNEEEDDRTSMDRWVSGSGTPGSFCLASWSPLGLWRLWFLCWGTTGAAVFPWPIPEPGILSVPLILGAASSANSFREHLRHLGDASTQEVKVDLEDDCRPRWDTASPTTKKEWKSTISTMKREASALTEPVVSAPFRASLFPTCLLHAEADLKPKKAFKEATLRTSAAGAGGLAFVRFGELAYAALGKDSTLQRMKDPCSGESPQDVDSLLSILRDSHKELGEVRKEISKISNVGSRVAAGAFNQGIEDLRHLVCESTTAKPIRSTLELCKPSLSHLFGDDARIEKALEAAKFKPYQAAPYRPKASSYSRSSDAQEGRDWKKKAYKRPYKSSQRPRSSGKAKGPASKKGEGQKKK